MVITRLFLEPYIDTEWIPFAQSMRYTIQLNVTEILLENLHTSETIVAYEKERTWTFLCVMALRVYFQS